MAVSHTVPAPVDFAAPQAPSSPFARPPRTYLVEVISRLRRNRTAMVGIGFITLLIALAIATPWIAPFGYGRGALQDANKLPSAAHWLGTDALGRDELTRLMWGARVSLRVAIGAEVIVILIGVTVGLVSGFFGGWPDYIVMRIVDALYSLPSLLIAILVMSFLRGVLSASNESSVAGIASLNTASGGLLGVFIVLFLTHWLTVCRLVRAQVMSVEERQLGPAARPPARPPPGAVRLHR